MKPDPTCGRPTVVLLHSSAASSRQWDALAASLRPAFDVHAIDLHGHGRQAPWAGDGPLSAHDEAALVQPLIDRAGPVHLIGHSYGAAVAVHLAAARPSCVRSLAVFEPVLFHLLAEHEPYGAATREVLELAEDLRLLVMMGQLDVAAQDFLDYWSGATAWQRMPPQQQQSAASRMPCVMQQFDALFREPLSAGALARLSMPVLCLSGSRSTPAAQRMAALLRTLLPRARHETLEGIGHLGPITHASLVNERLQGFLAEQVAHPSHPAAAAA
jgi:pimeloyl-ACP methyl ester carboxylesterase